MEKAENKYITVTYELYVEVDGKQSMIEKAPVEHPFQFITGLGTTLDAFEQNIVALSKGDNFDFTLSVEDAYGSYQDDFVHTVDKAMFEIDGKFDSVHVAPGKVIPLMDNEGHRFNATVTDVTDTQVTLDLNHPLAGKALNFKGQVVEYRDASNEEIQSLLQAMSGEGGCGGCGGDCGSGDCGGCGGHGEGCGCGDCN